MKVAVVGGTGFIGSHLIQFLLEETDFEVIALSRGVGASSHPRLSVRRCDLYIKSEIDRALEGCDMSVYLVHSMSKPTSRLVQGRFEDFDFLLADNFARAAKRNGLKQIVYVSGLLPEHNETLSKHLQSRYEVEKVLHDQAVPVTALRCGLVIGKNGSSFRIVERLVRRLPIMTLPAWMNHATQAVYVTDLVQVIVNCLRHPSTENRSYDIANPEVLTYSKIVTTTAKALRLNKIILNLPLIPIWLSKFWVRNISRVPKQLVNPLIDSLMHELTTSPNRLPPPNLAVAYTEIDDAIARSLDAKSSTYRLPITWGARQRRINEVQSVQRLPLPKGWTSERLAEEYKNWMPKLFHSLILAETTGDDVIFRFALGKFPLLTLRLRAEPDFTGRTLFDITGGSLANNKQNGVLEFREGLRRKFAVAAINRYRPKLIWYLYMLTQAQLHLWVMARFASHLKKINRDI